MRALTEADIPLAMALTEPEGWAFDAADFQRILRLGGGYVLESRGDAVGVLTTVVHGDVAWIGNVAVHPDHRGRGLGEALVAATLDALQERGVTRVGLYSVPKAVTLYERLGFSATGHVTSYQGAGPGPGARADAASPSEAVAPMAKSDLPAVAALDARLFGAPRHRLVETLLEDFPDTAYVLRDDDGLRGYAFAKPGDAASEVGPVGARPGDDHAAGALLDACLRALGHRAVEAAARDGNPAAGALLEARGLRPAFRATTMWWGDAPPTGGPDGVVAIAGLEKG